MRVSGRAWGGAHAGARLPRRMRGDARAETRAWNVSADLAKHESRDCAIVDQVIVSERI